MLSPVPPPGCEPGSFGEGCSQQCDCELGVPCDPITGLCLCPPGRTGASCDLGESGVPLGGGRGVGLCWWSRLCFWSPPVSRPGLGTASSCLVPLLAQWLTGAQHQGSCSGLSRPVLPHSLHLSPWGASPWGRGTLVLGSGPP